MFTEIHGDAFKRHIDRIVGICIVVRELNIVRAVGEVGIEHVFPPGSRDF